MTALTRRDALLLTAATTAASAALQSAAAQNPPAPPPPTEDATILEVPNGVVDGSLIPITVRIPSKDIALPTGDSLKRVAIDLSVLKDLNDDKSASKAFSTTLTDTALPTDATADIVVMTRLKIVNDPSKPPPAPPASGQTAAPPTQFTTKLLAAIDIQYKTAMEKKFTTHQPLTILPQDCAASNVAVLRLALQPPSVTKGKAMIVRAIMPTSPLPYPLNKITCTKPDDADSTKVATPFEMDIVQQQNGSSYLSDEVFVSFNLYPNKEGLVTMTWDYQKNGEQDATKKLDLTASAYVALTPPQT